MCVIKVLIAAVIAPRSLLHLRIVFAGETHAGPELVLRWIIIRVDGSPRRGGRRRLEPGVQPAVRGTLERAHGADLGACRVQHAVAIEGSVDGRFVAAEPGPLPRV